MVLGGGAFSYERGTLVPYFSLTAVLCSLSKFNIGPANSTEETQLKLTNTAGDTVVPLPSDHGILESHGQILALAFRQKRTHAFKLFPLRSET